MHGLLPERRRSQAAPNQQGVWLHHREASKFSSEYYVLLQLKAFEIILAT